MAVTTGQSPSWEADSFTARFRILQKPKVHYRVHNSPPPVPVMNQMNPVYLNTSDYFTINFNIITLSMTRSSKWSPSVRFPHQKSVRIYPLPHTCYMPHQAHFSWSDHANNIWWGVQFMKLLIMKFSPVSCYLRPLRPKYPPKHSILEHPQPMFLP